MPKEYKLYGGYKVVFEKENHKSFFKQLKEAKHFIKTHNEFYPENQARIWNAEDQKKLVEKIINDNK